MINRSLSGAILAAGLLVAAPVFAQSSSPTKTMTQKKKTDGDAPTTVGPGSKAYKQQTDGSSPTTVGPGSKAYKQPTDGEGPTQVGPGSRAYKN